MDVVHLFNLRNNKILYYIILLIPFEIGQRTQSGLEIFKDLPELVIGHKIKRKKKKVTLFKKKDNIRIKRKNGKIVKLI